MTLWEGIEGRDCGDHRTVGEHRAWCYDCGEWCYSGVARCRGCAAPTVRSLLAAARKHASALNEVLERLTEVIEP